MGGCALLTGGLQSVISDDGGDEVAKTSGAPADDAAAVDRYALPRRPSHGSRLVWTLLWGWRC